MSGACVSVFWLPAFWRRRPDRSAEANPERLAGIDADHAQRCCAGHDRDEPLPGAGRGVDSFLAIWFGVPPSSLWNRTAAIAPELSRKNIFSPAFSLPRFENSNRGNRGLDPRDLTQVNFLRKLSAIAEDHRELLFRNAEKQLLPKFPEVFKFTGVFRTRRGRKTNRGNAAPTLEEQTKVSPRIDLELCGENSQALFLKGASCT
jgi:hypothetical protein